MVLIPERLWIQMTPEEQELVSETMKGNRKSGKRIVCPHCRELIQVTFAVDITGADIPTLPAAPLLPAPGVGRLPTQYQAMLDAAKASGLYTHFLAALHDQNPSSKPVEADVLFCRYWPDVAPVHLTGRQNDLLCTAYGSHATVWGAYGVYVIVVDGLVVAFVPQRLLKSSVGTHRFQLNVQPQFDAWVKGPYGYVPLEARGFATELRRQNIGKFGALVQ